MHADNPSTGHKEETLSSISLDILADIRKYINSALDIHASRPIETWDSENMVERAIMFNIYQAINRFQGLRKQAVRAQSIAQLNHEDNGVYLEIKKQSRDAINTRIGNELNQHLNNLKRETKGDIDKIDGRKMISFIKGDHAQMWNAALGLGKMVVDSHPAERLSLGDMPVIQKLLSYITNRHQGILTVYLFGSWGTKYQTEYSDLDIAVLRDPSVSMGQLYMDVNTFIPDVSVDCIDPEESPNSIRFHIEMIKTGKKIYTSSPNYTLSWEANTLQKWQDNYNFREALKYDILGTRY